MKILTGWAHTLAERAGVSAVTVRRWQRTNRMPGWARILLALLRGELDAIDAAFAGWTIRRGELISPDGWCFAPGEIATIPLLYGQVNLWRAEALSWRRLPARAPLKARRLSTRAPGGPRLVGHPGADDGREDQRRPFKVTSPHGAASAAAGNRSDPLRG